jgi:hypothetical protein
MVADASRVRNCSEIRDRKVGFRAANLLGWRTAFGRERPDECPESCMSPTGSSPVPALSVNPIGPSPFSPFRAHSRLPARPRPTHAAAMTDHELQIAALTTIARTGIALDTLAALLDARHGLSAWCPWCRRWADLDLARLVARLRAAPATGLQAALSSVRRAGAGSGPAADAVVAGRHRAPWCSRTSLAVVSPIALERFDYGFFPRQRRIAPHLVVNQPGHLITIPAAQR